MSGKLDEVNATLDRFAKLIEENARRSVEDRQEAERQLAELKQRLAKEKIEFEQQLAKEKIEWQRQLDKEKIEWQRQLDKENTKWKQQLAKEKTEFEQQLAKEKAEFEQQLAKEKAEWKQQHDKEKAEWKQQHDNNKAEFEQQLAKEKAEWKQQHDNNKAEFEQQLAKEKAEREQQRADDKDEWEKGLADTNSRLGGQGNSIGEITEAITVSDNIMDLVNTFEGIDVEHFYFNITKKYPSVNSKGEAIRKQHEVDGLASGEKTVVVVEAKTVLTEGRVQRFIDKLANFKIAYPDQALKDLYGAVTFIRVDDDAFILAKQHGLFLIKASPPDVELANEKGFQPVKIV